MGCYRDALDAIFSHINFENQTGHSYNAATFDLSRIEALLQRLGRPQERVRCIHIAGTKGKGSTAAMAESILREAGYRTGLYTSPHLHTYRERIRVQGDLIPEDALVDLVDRGRAAFEATPGISAFEITTALALLYFAEAGVDWAVIEVGLGGRFDATNVVCPAVCAITSISYDHVDLLGHTLTSIAREKAGIIKARVPVVSAPQHDEVMEVLEHTCSAAGTRLVRVGQDWTWQARCADLTGQRFTVQRTVDGWSLPELHIPLLGRHQLANATAAVALTQELAGQGDVPVSAVRAGLAATRWPGRFEILQQHPAVVLDCAHNADSAVKLRATLDEVFPGHGRLALVFGASSDKDITGMFEVFLALGSANGFNPVDKIITTRSEHPRAADPAHLAGVAQSLSPACPTSIHQDTGSALDEALAWARPDDVICVTGSVFVVASARHVWSRSQPGTFSPDDWVSFDEDA